ncbi:phosphate/phosphite/phosphonate ABC transporter substrate-binding protein [Rhodococcus rhodochrous]|uniref:phosphate/phosphite/phosphonate ABC transporter substrate-binding protein n=1 Tax=Rhodococcus rhodochrous TaxID=1829 RepID=UPI0024BAE289|nr:phosphate/phosphite/phosphonate ABC transporter substrate-binding protein [Rhodococcus rhodochrous]MDJ0400974.1 phosphate/phosphite/phosphonate ABC transporter substrate-binding protein [Rhodococcus rhodochrous]
MRSLSSRRAAACAGLAAGLTLALTACGGSDPDTLTEQGFPETLTLGAIPAENSSDLKASYEPLLKMLEDETGSTVEFVQASDYAGVVEGMIADNVDLAFFGPFAYVVAQLNGADTTPLGAVVQDPGAEPGYRSYGLTQSGNSGIAGIEDFAGKDVCFVDPGSTSGFLYPSAGLIEAGVVGSGTEQDLVAGLTPVYAGGHDASALAIAAGDCDAGFAFDTMVDKTMIESGDLREGELKKVWESETIAGSLFVADNSLGTEAVERLAGILTEKGNADYLRAQGYCDGECRITDERAWGVVPATDADYDGVRHVCEITGSEKCKG